MRGGAEPPLVFVQTREFRAELSWIGPVVFGFVPNTKPAAGNPTGFQGSVFSFPEDLLAVGLPTAFFSSCGRQMAWPLIIHCVNMKYCVVYNRIYFAGAFMAEDNDEHID